MDRELSEKKLRDARYVLDRAGLALRDRTRSDEEAMALYGEARGLAQRAVVMLDHPSYLSEDGVADVLRATFALHGRVHAYCDRHRIRYASIDSTPTLVLRREEVAAAISAMRPGATQPPPELMTTLLGDQLVDEPE
jgi:hypothetical protein